MATIHPPETTSGTVTSWVPIVSQISMASACSGAIYSQVSGQLVAFDPFYPSIAPAFTTRCLPLEVTNWWNQPFLTSTISSLGPIICPDAYTTAFTAPLNGESTTIGCYPSGYAFQGTIVDHATLGQCASSLTPNQVITYLTTSTGPWYQTSTTVGPTGGSVLGVHINGWTFGAAATSRASTSTSATSAALSSPTSSSLPTATPSNIGNTPSQSGGSSQGNGPSNAGLSAGASAGIGVGAGFAVMAVCLLIGIVLRRRRRDRSGYASEVVQKPGAKALDESTGSLERATLNRGPHEMSSRPEPHELSSN